MTEESRVILQAQELSFSVRSARIVKSISLDVEENQFLSLVGPNGAGKSTFLRLIAGIQKETAGTVLLKGKPMKQWGLRERAKVLSFVEKEELGSPDLRVFDAVSMGLIPHRPPWGRRDSGEKMAVERALEKVSMQGFEYRTLGELSGGERRRVLLARAFAQDTEIIILDEPTNHLDVKYQHQILDLLRKSGRTVITALHDLDLALDYSSKVAVLKDGELVAQGDPQQTLIPEKLEPVFQVRVTTVPHPVTGRNRILLN